MSEPIVRVIITADSKANTCEVSIRVKIELAKKFSPIIAKALAIAFVLKTGGRLWDYDVLQYSYEFTIDESYELQSLISTNKNVGLKRLEEYHEFIEQAAKEQAAWQEGGKQ